jgi:SAM-dependent methyltransferase
VSTHFDDIWTRTRELSPARGYADDAELSTGRIDGWILVPEKPLDWVTVFVNGREAGRSGLTDRPDVAAFYARIPHAHRSGFSVTPAPGMLLANGINHVVVIGGAAGKPIARLRTVVFPPACIPSVLTPPAEFIELTQGDHNADAYRMLGYRYYLQFMEVLGRHREMRDLRTLLDWGCGSGRVAAYFVREHPQLEVVGCDINERAIAWCNDNLAPGRFQVVREMPPLPFPDRKFDCILALGVVGWCGPDDFALWLEELHRVLRPGGLLLVSVQGAFAAAPRFPPDALQEMVKEGFLNGTQYDQDHPPAESDPLYRGGYYLTPKYIAHSWAARLRILEHLEGEINSDQDLVVLERP